MILSLPCEVNQSSKKPFVYVNLINQTLLLFFIQSREEGDGSALTTNDRRDLTESLGKNENGQFQMTEAKDEFVQFALLALAELVGTIVYE